MGQTVTIAEDGRLGQSGAAEPDRSVPKLITAGREVTGEDEVKGRVAEQKERTGEQGERITRSDRDRTLDKEANITEREVTGEGEVKAQGAGLGKRTTRSGRASKKPSRYIEQF